MAIDLATIQSNSRTALALGVGLVVPQTDVGIVAQLSNDPAFFFHFEGENTADLDCEITDHFVEDNTAIQDQIAIKPEIVTTRGFIGELTDALPLDAINAGQFGKLGRTAISKLILLSDLMPDLTTSALIAYNEAAQAAAAAAIAARAVGNGIRAVGGKGTQTEQQKAYTKFKKYRAERRLFTVQTPWEVLKDMAILRLRATQGEETSDITTFDITFKQMRFARTVVQSVVLADGRAAAQNSTEVDQGAQVPSPTDSLATQAADTGLA